MNNRAGWVLTVRHNRDTAPLIYVIYSDSKSVYLISCEYNTLYNNSKACQCEYSKVAHIKHAKKRKGSSAKSFLMQDKMKAKSTLNKVAKIFRHILQKS